MFTSLKITKERKDYNFQNVGAAVVNCLLALNVDANKINYNHPIFLNA